MDQNREIKYNKKELLNFEKNWKFVHKPNDYIEKQYHNFFTLLINYQKVIVLLGATNTYSDLDQHLISKHIGLNQAISNVAKCYKNVSLIDVDKFITNKNDFTNAIRHYSRPIYKKIADEINFLVVNI